jgi:hypothetical protein
MSRLVTLTFLAAAMALLPRTAGAQPKCTAPTLSEQQLGEIVRKAREARKDLPAPFSGHTIVVRRQGCHYLYIEYAVPRTPDKQNIFTINQHGVIVDTQPPMTECPGKALSEQDLAEIVKQARAARTDLPQPYPKFTTRVAKMRCLFTYFEYAAPAQPGDFQVFTIDGFGEILEASRNKRY